MALLRDHRRCVALELDDFRLAGDSDSCTLTVGVRRVDAGGGLQRELRVEGVRERVSELRTLAEHVRALTTGEVVASHFETMDDGFSLQLEREGERVRVEAWIDLVRLNPATRVLASRGEPQVGLRFSTRADELQRFWADLLEGLERMYS